MPVAVGNIVTIGSECRRHSLLWMDIEVVQHLVDNRAESRRCYCASKSSTAWLINDDQHCNR